MMDVDVALTCAKLTTYASTPVGVLIARFHLLNGFEVIHIFGSSVWQLGARASILFFKHGCSLIYC